METNYRTMNIQEELKQKGFLYLENQEYSQVPILISSIGKLLYITDVICKPQSRPLVTSDKALGFHTDYHRAKYILWYCFEQTSEGGETLLVDALSIYYQLPEALKIELQNIQLFEHKVFDGDKEIYPMITLDYKGNIKIYYSFWLLNPEDKQKTSIQTFEKLIYNPSNIQTFRLKPQDILIIDNQRMLHARNAIQGTKNRFLKRFWIENFNS